MKPTHRLKNRVDGLPKGTAVTPIGTERGSYVLVSVHKDNEEPSQLTATWAGRDEIEEIEEEP